MMIIDWSSDVCSSDLGSVRRLLAIDSRHRHRFERLRESHGALCRRRVDTRSASRLSRPVGRSADQRSQGRSEEHTSELQSLMRISYAVFCLKKKKKENNTTTIEYHIKILNK